ncbi:MAG: biotin/lipoyl-containing protein [Acidobacteriaceae bacterium]
MPGRIVQLTVSAGDTVKADQASITMEAMKMRNELKTPRAGTATRIAVEAGAMVQAGKLLLAME